MEVHPSDMIIHPDDKERCLKPEYEVLHIEWLYTYYTYGCTCFKSAPCNSCTHEGNMLNLMEDEDAWESVVKYMVREVANEILNV